MNSANLYCNFNRRGAENRIENFLFVFFSLYVKPNSKPLRLCGSYKYYVPLIQLTVYLFYHRGAENRIENFLFVFFFHCTLNRIQNLNGS
jgi:hypothetical protein